MFFWGGLFVEAGDVDVALGQAGFEFGFSTESFNEFEPGDIVEFFVTQKVEAV